MLKNLTDDQRLDFMLDNVGKMLAAKVKSESSITQGTSRGKSAEIDVGGARGLLRVFVTKTRNYQLMVLGPKDGAGATQGAKFFETFQIEGK
ncbi:MAG: hypothetical protein K8T25_13860 [Planctomycetia bacterium]|nr:hypothetical protein [Planctomycetia bacterium]